MTPTKEEEDGSVSDASFQRLKEIVREIEEKKTDSMALKEEIADEDGLVARHVYAQSLGTMIEEKEIMCKNHKKNIELVQKLILAKRRIMYEVQEKIDKREKDEMKLAEKTEGLVVQVEANKINKQKIKKVTSVLTRICAYRRLQLLQEVTELFKIDIDGGPAAMQPARKRLDCKCVLVDTIRGLHLPHVASIQLSPHNEIETTAAIGLLIHAIDIISRILGYPLRYPIYHYASFSKIVCPAEEKVATLSGWKRRSDRERFFEGLNWLGKNIAQLRSDCGIPTPVADKNLSVLADWVRSVTEGKYVCIYDRPMENAASPSSILINFQPSSSSEKSEKAEKAEKAGKVEKVEKTDKTEEADQPEKAEAE